MVVLSYFVAFSLVMYSTFVGIIAWRSIRMSSQEASWTFAERTSAAWACNFHVASPPILLHFKRTQCSGIPKSSRFGEFGIKITAFNWGGGEGRGNDFCFKLSGGSGYHDTFENRHIFYGSIVVFVTKKPSFFSDALWASTKDVSAVGNDSWRWSLWQATEKAGHGYCVET